MQEHLSDKSQEDEPKNEKALRADDAGVPVELWNERVAEKLTKHWSDLSNLTSADRRHLGRRLEAGDMDEVFNSSLDKLRVVSLHR